MQHVQLRRPTLRIWFCCSSPPVLQLVTVPSGLPQFANRKSQNTKPKCNMFSFIIQIVTFGSSACSLQFRRSSLSPPAFSCSFLLLHFWSSSICEVYEEGISFNAIQNNSFEAMLEATGQFGLGYKEPSRYQLSEPLWKEEVYSTKEA
ncbi:hypothetical protein Ddye_021183 [Dipteronia dyeriana]|uniref:Uncharacterized protein n=1 Tax=Dipteronia dyeriana TaxID=168575 RepID=A0AAD9U1L8_9ROSI|nr:hypothetical protein Ddye_021183 [Dipteronia dyeriana]